MSWELEPGGTNDLACECCGQRSRTIDGFLHEDGATRAAYLVHWTRGHVSEKGANVDLIIGRWGEDAGRDERFVVSLVYHQEAGFTVIDSAGRPAAESSLAARALARKEVIGTDLAADVFAMVDVVWLRDARISEIAEAG